MTDERGPVSLLEERPKLESALETVLDVDSDHEGWTFQDVAIDSGEFGELVSHEIVVADGDEYRVADPDAVRRALDKEPVASEESVGSGFEKPSRPLDTRALGLVYCCFGGTHSDTRLYFGRGVSGRPHRPVRERPIRVPLPDRTVAHPD